MSLMFLNEHNRFAGVYAFPVDVITNEVGVSRTQKHDRISKIHGFFIKGFLH